MKQKSDKDKLEEINKNLKSYEDVFGTALSQGYLYRTFGLGEQWSGRDLVDLETYDMAPLVDNQIDKHYKKIFGEFSANLPDLSLSSLSLTNSDEMINQMEEMMRQGMSRSQSEQVITQCFENTSRTGNSCGIYLYTDYKDNETMQQEWYIDYISASALRFDPDASDYTKSDGEWIAYVRPMDKEQFKKKFPDADWDTQMSVSNDYFNREHVTTDSENVVFIAHYFEKHYHTQTLYQTNFGRVIKDKKELQMGESVINKRESQDISIKGYKTTQTEILEEMDVPFSCLPIFVVSGNYEIIDGRPRPYPLGYHAFDKQKVLNLSFSQTESCMRNLRKETLVVDKRVTDNNEGLRMSLETPLRHTGAFVTEWKDGSTGIHITPPNEMPKTLPEMYASMVSGIDRTMGIYDAAQGAQSNEISGIASMLKINQNNIGIYQFVKNVVFAMQALGRELVTLLPKIYVEERLMKLSGIMTMLNPSADNIHGDLKKMVFDQIEKQSVDVEIKVSPTFQVQVQNQMNMLVQLLQLSPENKDLIIPKLLKLSEIPSSASLAQDIIKMTATTNPTAYAILKGASVEQIEQQAQQQHGAAQGQQQQAAQIATQEATSRQQDRAVRLRIDQEKLALQQAKNDIEQRKAQLEELEMEADFHLANRKQTHQENMDVANYGLDQSKQRTELLRPILAHQFQKPRK
jgi:hypothetical protein